MKKRIKHKLEKKKYTEEEREYNKLINLAKKMLPKGPWSKELNKVTFNAYGYECVIIRQLHGTLCGYVGITRTHPYCILDYDNSVIKDVYVHGGITYASNYLNNHPKSNHIAFWFGFDTNHGQDYCPLWGKIHYYEKSYKNISYVKNECIQLAKQLREIENKHPELIGTPNRYPDGVLT